MSNVAAPPSGTSESKARFFVLEAFNSIGAAFYFNYLFFFLRQEFHLSNQASLAVAGLHGFFYMLMSRLAGHVAQRRGYLRTFRLGCMIVAAALVAGSLVRHSLVAQLLTLVGWTVGICLTWPPLQALVADRETPARTAWLVGIYNLVWSGFAGLANFFGGAIYEQSGGGGLFWVPAVLSVGMALAASRLQRLSPTRTAPGPEAATESAPVPHAPRELNRRFLLLARIANPFAYVAINTVVPMIPDLAHGLKLSPTESGWITSIWFFVRWAIFVVLWRWVGWHYKMRWMLAAYLGLIAGFLVLILAPHVWVLVLGQTLFGVSIGLIYYSSLFYSMDAGDDKGAHGGLHESAIGLGLFVGPALGAVATALHPEGQNQAVWVVGVLLVAGLAVIVWKGCRKGSEGRG